MVAPPADLLPAARAPASRKPRRTPLRSAQTSDSSLGDATPVLPMSCSEEDLSSPSSDTPALLTPKSVSSSPVQTDTSKPSSILTDDAISLKTASSLETAARPGQNAHSLGSSSEPPPSERGSGRCLHSRFPVDFLPPTGQSWPRSPVCATPEAGCARPGLLAQFGMSASKPQLSPAFGPMGLSVGERQALEDQKEGIERQLSSLEARLKAVQERQTLWLRELVPAVRRVRWELANIGQSLGRLVQLFEPQAAACPHFQATREKAAAEAEGGKAGGRPLFHPATTCQPCQGMQEER